MAKQEKKIFLLLAGGTCILDDKGNILSVQNQEDVPDWLSQMPELNILANIEPVVISGEDDLVGPSVWQKLVKFIVENEKEAGGFVVVSKIDQLVNTSLALGFGLQNFKKTVVCTSSQVSGSSFIDKKEVLADLKSKHGGLSLRANLINAIQVASHPLPSTAIIFGTRLIEATKVVADLGNDVNVFSSIDGNYWGQVDFGINIKSKLKYNQQSTKVYDSSLANVLVIEDIPGVAWNFDKKELNKYKGLFVKVGPYQALEKSKQEQISKWNMPVVLYNYNLTSPVKGAVRLAKCTKNTAIVKTMWALSDDMKDQDFENIMNKNIIGEFLN